MLEVLCVTNGAWSEVQPVFFVQ